MENSPIKNKDRVHKEISMRDPEETMLDDECDSRVLASIANQEVLYEGRDVNQHISRERKINQLEAEIESLNASRKNE